MIRKISSIFLFSAISLLASTAAAKPATAKTNPTEGKCGDARRPSLADVRRDSDDTHEFFRMAINVGSGGGCALDARAAIYSLVADGKKVTDPSNFYLPGMRKVGISWFLVSDCSRSRSAEKKRDIMCLVLRVEKTILHPLNGPGPREIGVVIHQEGALWRDMSFKISG